MEDAVKEVCGKGQENAMSRHRRSNMVCGELIGVRESWSEAMESRTGRRAHPRQACGGHFPFTAKDMNLF